MHCKRSWVQVPGGSGSCAFSSRYDSVGPDVYCEHLRLNDACDLYSDDQSLGINEPSTNDRVLACNYHPASLKCVPCKLLEHIVCSVIAHLDKHKLLSHRQYAFRKRHSCEIQLIPVIKDWAKILDKSRQVDTFILDSWATKMQAVWLSHWNGFFSQFQAAACSSKWSKIRLGLFCQVYLRAPFLIYCCCSCILMISQAILKKLIVCCHPTQSLRVGR